MTLVSFFVGALVSAYFALAYIILPRATTVRKGAETFGPDPSYSYHLTILQSDGRFIFN